MIEHTAKEKRAAQFQARQAIRKGELERRPCEAVLYYRATVCGRTPTHAHHEDYTRPLDVVWLCASCHRHRHWQMSQTPPYPLRIERPGLPQLDRDW